MSDDIVERLRKRSVVDTQLHRRWRSAQLMSQAADEIERLRNREREREDEKD